MKIFLLHYTAPPVVGGVESVMGNHARLLAEGGYEVSVIAGQGEKLGDGIGFEQIDQVDSRHAGVLEVKSKLDQGIVPEQFFVLKDQIAARLRPLFTSQDVIIAHNVCSLHMNLALTAALHEITAAPGASRLILWHHDLAWTSRRYQSELHKGPPWNLLRTDWTWAHQVAVSETRRYELADLLDVSSERIQVIPNGIDPALFYKFETQTSEWVKRLDLFEARPILLLPVRITPRKNIEFALYFLAQLKEIFPKAVLVITGPVGAHNPENVDYFEALVELRKQLKLEDNAIFMAELIPKPLPDEIIRDFYRLADALFLPSREEGFGIPLLEAGLTGVPIFCSDIESLRRLGGRHVHYFSPDENPGRVAKRIADYFQSDHIFQMRADVRSEYHWNSIYTRYIAPLIEHLDEDHREG